MLRRKKMMMMSDGIRYIIRDNFNNPLAAGSVNGTPSTPGPGTRTTSAGISIANGRLVFPGSAQSFYLSKVINASDIKRTPGLAVSWKTPVVPTVGTGYFGIFEGSTKKEVTYGFMSLGYYDTRIYDFSVFVTDYCINYHRNVKPTLHIILEPNNTRYFISDSFRTRLLWASLSSPGTGNFRVGSSSISTDGELDSIKVWQSRLSPLDNTALLDIANPVTGTEYEATNEKDLARGMALHIINITAPTPLSGSVELRFRQYLADMYYSFTINSSGDCILYENLNGSGTATDQDLAKISAGDNVTLYIYTDDIRVQTYQVVNSVLKSDQTIWYKDYPNWNLTTEPTIKVLTATDFVVNRWRCYPLVSEDYNEINVPRTAQSFFSIGDSKTSGDGWQTDFISQLGALGNDQWWEFPGSYSQGGWKVSSIASTIDAAIAYRYGYPNYILINLGSNESGTLPNEATYKAEFSYIIDALHMAYPSAKIYLARPVRLNTNPPSVPTADNTTIRGWTDDIIATYAGSGYVYAGIDETQLEGGDSYVTNLVDYTHYTAAGKVAMRGLWKTAMGY